MSSATLADSAGRSARFARLISFVFLALAAIRFWIMPLGSSLYCDEAGSFWTVQAGLGQMWHRYLEFPSTPPAYALVFWAATSIGGMNETAMRFPSLLGIALATLLLYRLAKRLFGPEAALPTVAAFVCSKWIILASIDARPYAILLALIIGSTLALVNWFDSGRRRDAVV